MAFGDFPDIWDIVSFKLIFFVFFAAILRQYLKGSQFTGKENAKKKVVVITGCNCGIGKQIVRELNYRGAKVYMGCRDQGRGTVAVEELAKLGCPLDRLILFDLDMSNFASIKRFAQFVQSKESEVHVLINNAGVMMYPRYKQTEDGHEYQWQVNYLGHFLLTNLLRPQLEASQTGRVVNVTCPAANAGKLSHDQHLKDDKIDTKAEFDVRAGYSRSKLALLMMARSLTKHWRQSGSSVTINTANPGLCYTRHLRHTPILSVSFLRYTLGWVAWYLMKTPKDGAQTPLYCALETTLGGVSGKYFSDCKEADVPKLAADEEALEQLYQYSLRVCTV